MVGVAQIFWHDYPFYQGKVNVVANLSQKMVTFLTLLQVGYRFLDMDAESLANRIVCLDISEFGKV